MDPPGSPFRAVDVLSSDDEPNEFLSDDWSHIDAHGSGVFHVDLPELQSIDNPELREDVEDPDEGLTHSESGALVSSLLAPDAVESSFDASSSPQVDATVSSIDWNQMIAASFGQYRARHSDIAFPWESGVMAEIFGAETSLSLPQCAGIGEGLDRLTAHLESEVATGSIVESLPHDAKYLGAVQSLKDVPYFENKAHKLELACGLWMDILSTDWSSSEVGTHLSASLLSDSTGLEAVEILRACFGVKSPSTLIKRANAFRQFISWHFKCGFGTLNNAQALPLSEQAVWEYFHYLRDLRLENKRGYTVPSSFLEAVRFGKFTLGLKFTDTILQSRRLLGFAAIERRDKGPSRQAPGLEVEHVKRLHAVLREGSNDIDRLGAGCFLICLYSRARWSDVRYVDHVEITEGKFGALTLFTVEHKTATVGLRREAFLPLIVPWEGIVNEDWIKIFMDVYQKCGLDLTRQPLGPLHPAPKTTGQFCARPLTTGEAANWLRALLDGTTDAHLFRSHSLKASLLIWAAKAGFDKETRAVLGHHASALQGSDVVYSRHLQTRALRKLSMLLRRVRVGLDIEDDQMKEFGIMQTPAIGTPAPRTPGVVLPSVPQPAPVVEGEQTSANVLSAAIEAAQCLEDLQSVKEEQLTLEEAENQAENVSLFPLEAVQSGLVQIDSSSGSESDSSSYDSSDEPVREPATFSHPRYSEEVPADRDFYRHFKSGILHSCEAGKKVAICKVSINSNYRLMSRTMQVRYAKCIRCFPRNNNRLRSVDDVADALDSAVKRVRK